MMNLIAPARIIVFLCKRALVLVVALSANVLYKLVIHIMGALSACEHRFTERALESIKKETLIGKPKELSQLLFVSSRVEIIQSYRGLSHDL